MLLAGCLTPRESSWAVDRVRDGLRVRLAFLAEVLNAETQNVALSCWRGGLARGVADEGVVGPWVGAACC